jgi:hypothetical protein
VQVYFEIRETLRFFIHRSSFAMCKLLHIARSLKAKKVFHFSFFFPVDIARAYARMAASLKG